MRKVVWILVLLGVSQRSWGHQQVRCFVVEKCLERILSCTPDSLQDGGWNAWTTYRIGKKVTCVTDAGLQTFWTYGEQGTLYATGSITFYTMPSRKAAIAKCESDYAQASRGYHACVP
ncbi:MAG: hypothetical protein AB7F86_00840 [Bdellovibrionales bacterium]